MSASVLNENTVMALLREGCVPVSVTDLANVLAYFLSPDGKLVASVPGAVRDSVYALASVVDMAGAVGEEPDAGSPTSGGSSGG